MALLAELVIMSIGQQSVCNQDYDSGGDYAVRTFLLTRGTAWCYLSAILTWKFGTNFGKLILVSELNTCRSLSNTRGGW